MRANHTDNSLAVRRFSQYFSMILLAEILLASFLCVFLNVALSHAHDGEIETSTNHLVQLTDHFQEAAVSERDAVKNHLLQLVSKRKTLLLQTLKEDPAAFLRHAVPAKLRNRLPSEVQDYVEEEVTLQGELIVLVADDFTNGRSEIIFKLISQEDPDEIYTLHFAANPPVEKSGSIVIARGFRLDSELVLAQGGGSSLETTESTEASTESVTAQDRRVAVMLINFENDRKKPFSARQVSMTLFTSTDSVNAFMQATSFGQVSLSGDVFGAYTIPFDSSQACPVFQWATAADDAAMADGVDLASYDHRMYVFPGTSSCSWAGLGTLGGLVARTWYNGGNYRYLYAHELGHNLRLHHASSLNCGTNAIDDYVNCMSYEYGDPSDAMGGGYHQYNGPHKKMLGWIPSSRIQDVTADGIYTIYATELDSPDLQLLEIPKPDSSSSGDSESYYISFRQPYDFDADLPPGMVRGASVHIASASSSLRQTLRTHIIDTTPGNGFDDAALADSVSFYDPINGITVSQISHDTVSATVSVEFGEVTCARASPSISASPLSQTGSPGDTLDYIVSVTNNDSPGCPSTTYDLSSSIGRGWSETFSQNPLTLEPGSAVSATWSVTSKKGGQNASYGIFVYVTDSVAPNRFDSAHVTYLVIH